MPGMPHQPPKSLHQQPERRDSSNTLPGFNKNSATNSSGRSSLGNASQSQNRPKSMERTSGSDALRNERQFTGRASRDYEKFHQDGNQVKNGSSSGHRQSRWGIREDQGDLRFERVPLNSTETKRQPNHTSPRKSSDRDFEFDQRRLHERYQARPTGHERPWEQQRRVSSDSKSRSSRSLDSSDRGMSSPGRPPRSPSLERVFRRASLSAPQSETTDKRLHRRVEDYVWTQGKRISATQNCSPERISQTSRIPNHGRVSPERTLPRNGASTMQHRSSLGSRWGPRATTAEPISLKGSLLESGEGRRDGNFGDPAECELSKERLGNQEISLKGSLLEACDRLPHGRNPMSTTDPDQQIPIACIGFTAKESRAVETTDLTEVSITTSSLDGTNAIRSTSSSSTLSSWLPDPKRRESPPTLPPVVTVPPMEPSLPDTWFKRKLLERISKPNVYTGGKRDGSVVRSKFVSDALKTITEQTPIDANDEGIPRKKSVLNVPTPKPAANTNKEKNTLKDRKLEKSPELLPVDSKSPGKVTVANQSSASEAKVLKAKDCTDPSLVKVGSRVAVYWDGEARYYKGRVIKERVGKKKPFFLRYDDGDEEWMTFEGERFRLLSPPSKPAEIVQESPRSDIAKPREHLPSPPKTAAVLQKAPRSIATKRRPEHEHLSPPPKTAVVLQESPQFDVTMPCAEREQPLQPSSVAKKRKDSPFGDGVSCKRLRSGAEETVVLADETKDANAPLAKTDAGSVERIGTHEANVSRERNVEKEPRIGDILAIETKVPIPSKKPERDVPVVPSLQNPNELDWVAAGVAQHSDCSDSDTDEEELLHWAATMLGAAQPIARRRSPNDTTYPRAATDGNASPESTDWESILSIADVPMSISEKVKLGRRKNSCSISYSVPAPLRKKTKLSCPKKRMLSLAEKEHEAKLKKEQARPLTADEINSIIGDDSGLESSTWVRRSVRQPSKSTLNAPRVKALLEKLAMNDPDMVVLKMKKYCSDLDTPSLVIDAVLDALEENTNCEALYIQNFNEGMRDDQVLHLLQVLQRPSCKIWCLNIGETYNVKMKTWEKFTNGLESTKITHMYASEHTITAELKDQIRETIRLNRSKHKMHCDPNNLDTIVKCTHCWWNPINTKSLRPYLQKKGYDHILADAEVQGLQGSMSGATLS